MKPTQAVPIKCCCCCCISYYFSRNKPKWIYHAQKDFNNKGTVSIS